MDTYNYPDDTAFMAAHIEKLEAEIKENGSALNRVLLALEQIESASPRMLGYSQWIKQTARQALKENE